MSQDGRKADVAALAESFYKQLVEQYGETTPSPTKSEPTIKSRTSERRRALRRRFLTVQSLAPIYSLDQPVNEPDFVRVKCFDLSSIGFSFFTNSPPDFQWVVARFNVGPNTIRVKARVIRTTETNNPDHRYLIGCEFMERLP